MTVTQIYQMINTISQEVTGGSVVVNENLNNIVDVGEALLTSNYREAYVNSLLNQIGRMEFVDRTYEGAAPDIRREAWEWGSIKSKSRTKDFQAVENPTWTMQAGQSVDQYVFTPPEVQTTLFNKMITWEIDCSFVNRQLNQSFGSASQFDAFASMLRTQIRNCQVQTLDALSMRTINSLTGRRINKNIGVIDLLAKYNAQATTQITAAQALTNKDFLRFAALQILLVKDRMKVKSAAYSENATGYTTFTPAAFNHLVLLSDMAKGIDVYLQSETFHNDFTEIGKYETVPYWQGSGTSDFNIADTSRIDIVLPQITPAATVKRNYIVGVMFDFDALGIINEDQRVEVAYNARGEYWNNFFKIDTRLYNDPAENCVVFTIGTGVIND